MDNITAQSTKAGPSDEQRTLFPHTIGLYRPCDYDALLPWDVHWTMAVVQAMRQLSLPSCVAGGELRFETREAQAAVLAVALQRHKEAVKRHRRDTRGFETSERPRRKE